MAHFAQLDEDNLVSQVIVVSNQELLDENGNEVEDLGIAFCKNLFGSDTNWRQTSFHNNFRVRYANIGDTYNEELDAFIVPKLHNSWILNGNTIEWNAPVPAPLTNEETEYLESILINENIKIVREKNLDIWSIKCGYCEWDEENKVWIRNNI